MSDISTLCLRSLFGVRPAMAISALPACTSATTMSKAMFWMSSSTPRSSASACARLASRPTTLPSSSRNSNGA